jgi:hypothetical protein
MIGKTGRFPTYERASISHALRTYSGLRVPTTPILPSIFAILLAQIPFHPPPPPKIAMNQRKTYFIVPGNDYAPDELIQLGQIISDLKLPHRRLSPPLQPLPKVYSPWKKDYGAEKNKTLSGSIGVFAQALAIVDADVAGNISKEKLNSWEFERLDTEFIEPDEAYVNSSVQVKVVKDFLNNKTLRGKAVYMVTGLKIARGPSATRKQVDEIGGEGKIGLDATATTGVPVQGGPKLSLSRKREDSEWFSSSSDFVFAYRLQKISVSWSGSMSSKEVTGGDLLGHGDDVSGSEDEDEVDGLGEIEWVQLDRRDLGSDYVPVGFRTVAVRDDADDQECQVLWFKDG